MSPPFHGDCTKPLAVSGETISITGLTWPLHSGNPGGGVTSAWNMAIRSG